MKRNLVMVRCGIGEGNYELFKHILDKEAKEKIFLLRSYIFILKERTRGVACNTKGERQ